MFGRSVINNLIIIITSSSFSSSLKLITITTTTTTQTTITTTTTTQTTITTTITTTRTTLKTDGASACLLMKESRALELGYEPKAYLPQGSAITWVVMVMMGGGNEGLIGDEEEGVE